MWFLKFIIAGISELLIGVIDFLGQSLDNIFDTMYKLNKLLNLDDAKNYIVAISLILVCVFYVKNAIGTYVLRTEGDFEEDPLESLVRVTKCAAVILCGDWLIDYGINLATKFTSDIESYIPASNKSLTGTIADLLTKVLGFGTTLQIIQGVLTIIIFILYLIFIWKAGKRGAELIVFQLFIPFMALDILKANDERWRNFSTELVICIFGYILQVICFSVFLRLYAQAMSPTGLVENPYAFIAALSWMGFVINGPKWLQKHMYKSGIGDLVKGGGRSALYVIPQFLRR